MVNTIPIELFFGLMGILLVIPIIAYAMKTHIYSSMVFFICGVFILVLALGLDGIETANLPTNSTTVGSTTTYEFEPQVTYLRNTETLEPNIMGLMILFVAVIVIIIGVLVEVK